METEFAPVYMARRAAERIAGFFSHWYVGGTRYFLYHFTLRLQKLDKGFAVRANLRHMFEPLYRDYSIVGHIIGPPMRFFRVLIGGAIYLCLAAVFIVFYVLWCLFLPAVVAYAFIRI